jgi:hypothetical protein
MYLLKFQGMKEKEKNRLLYYYYYYYENVEEKYIVRRENAAIYAFRSGSRNYTIYDDTNTSSLVSRTNLVKILMTRISLLGTHYIFFLVRDLFYYY